MMGPCQKVALVVLTLLGVLPFITAHELPSNTTWLGEHGPSASSAAALKLMDTHLEDLSAFDAAVSGHLMTSDINYMNQTVVRPTPLPAPDSLSRFPLREGKPCVVIFTMGSRGDVVPYIPLCKAINAIGIRCVLITHEPYRNMVEAEGVHFEGVPDTVEDLQEEMDVAANHGLSSIKLWQYSRSSRFRNRFTTILSALTQKCIELQPAVIYTVAWTWAAVDFERLFARPVIILQPQPFTPTSRFSHCYVEDKLKAMSDLLPSSLRPTLNDYSNYATIALLLMHSSSALHEWRSQYPKLIRQKTEDERRNLLQTPAIYGFSPALVPRPSDYPSHVHIVGSWQPTAGAQKPSGEDKAEMALYEDIMHFIDEAEKRGDRVVFIGFGSMLPRDTDHYERMVEDVALSPNVSVIYQRPGNGIGNVRKETKKKRWFWQREGRAASLPSDRVFVLRRSIQHHYFFHRLKAAVIHGGAGIIATSIRNALPVIVKPFFGDQFLWCQMVVQEGWGACLNKQFSAGEVVRAVQRVIDDPAYAAMAKQKSAEVAQEDGFAGFMESSSKEITDWVSSQNVTGLETVKVHNMLLQVATTMSNGAVLKQYTALL